MNYAIKSIKMRADAGDPEAMVKLGKKFFSGDGVKKNRCKAEKYFKKAALENCAEAYVELGKLYQTGYAYGNGELAEELWTKAVSLGSAEAAYLIGRLYYQAGRVPRNKDKAEQWYKIAVEKGYAPALYELGDIYLSQYEGRAQESLALFEKAAEGGVAEAYLKLAELYGYNFADRPDSADKALKYLKTAAEMGVKGAQRELGTALYLDVGNEKNAIAALEKAAEEGDDIAMSLLGDLYYKGLAVKRDFDRAYYWYSRHFDKYSEPTYFGLGRCYLYGVGVKCNKAKGFKYLTAAAKYLPQAKYELGNCYFNGWGVKRDSEMAKQLWEQAAEEDYDLAREALEENFKG